MSRPKAYSYVRISSKAQIAGSGILRQMEKAREYAETNNLDLDVELHDTGRSGFHGDHVKFGALGGFLKLVKDGKIASGSYLLVEALDRLSREDVLIAQRQFIDILLAGITIVTLLDNQVYHKDREYTQLIMSLSIMKGANDESLKKSERIKYRIKQRKLEALNGAARYNHHLVGWIDQKRADNGKDYVFTLNDKVCSVRRIFELADQGIGAHSIARILNQEKLPVLREKRNTESRWKDASVWLVIKNEICIGTYQIFETVDGKRVPLGDPIPNYYPAAVDEELFWRVNRKRGLKKQAGAKGRRYSNLFARNTSCAHCGKVLRYSRGGDHKKPHFYFSCQDRLTNSDATCPTQMYRYDEFEQAVLFYATDFHDAAMGLHRAGKVDEQRIENELSQAKAQLAEFEEERSSAMEMSFMLKDPQDRIAMADRINDTRAKIEETKQVVKRLQERLNDISDDRVEITTLAKHLADEQALWKTSTSDSEIFESRARVANMLNEFISMVEVDFETLEATVWVAGFTSAYRFDNRGNLTTHINLIDMFRPLGSKAFKIEYSDGTKQIRQPKTPILAAAISEEQMIDFMQNMGWDKQRIALALNANRKMVQAANARYPVV